MSTELTKRQMFDTMACHAGLGLRLSGVKHKLQSGESHEKDDSRNDAVSGIVLSHWSCGGSQWLHPSRDGWR